MVPSPVSETVRCLAVLIAERDDLVRLHPIDLSTSLGAAAGVADLDELLAANLVPPVFAIFGEPGIRQRPSSVASVTRTAVPSTTTSLPLSQPLAPVVPVVTATRGLASRLRCFCSFDPVQNANAPSCQTPTSGTACGRPSVRTVMIQ